MTEKKIKVDNLNIYKINNTLDYYRYIASDERKDDDLLIYGEKYNKFIRCPYINVFRFLIRHYPLFAQRDFSDEEIEKIGKGLGQLFLKKEVTDKELVGEFLKGLGKYNGSLSYTTHTMFRFYYSEKFKNGISPIFADNGNNKLKVALEDIEILENNELDKLEYFTKCCNGIYCEIDVQKAMLWNLTTPMPNDVAKTDKLMKAFLMGLLNISPAWFFVVHR